MMNFILPKKIIDEFTKSGILAVGEYHGVKENYDFYINLLSQLPEIPNLAIEIKESEKRDFEKFMNGVGVESLKTAQDGRVNYELFNFLKTFIEKYPEKKIIYFDETDADIEALKIKIVSRDEQMANNFLREFEKPVLLIGGNIHFEKKIISLDDREIVPMGYLLKNKIGDFPFITIIPISGTYFNYGIKEFIREGSKPLIYDFIEKEGSKFVFYFENATPVTLL